jgi:voltage-gated potassium channel
MGKPPDGTSSLAGDGSTERHAHLTRAELLARSLDTPMGILGVLFLVLVLAQVLVTDEDTSRVLAVAGWAFWAIFVFEFLLRAYIARFQLAFWKRNWWQVVFLLVPFLRFFRALGALRAIDIDGLGRAGSLTSAGVRVTRLSVRLLSTRAAIFIAAIVSRSPRGRKHPDDGK